jgi:nitrogen regulatory protein P-II 1
VVRIAIVRQEKVPFVRAALEEIGVNGLTITQVYGHGHQRGVVHQWKGNTYRVDLLPKVKLETVIHDRQLDRVLRVIHETASTGEVGDGKVFVSTIDDAMRVRTNERGGGPSEHHDPHATGG